MGKRGVEWGAMYPNQHLHPSYQPYIVTWWSGHNFFRVTLYRNGDFVVDAQIASESYLTEMTDEAIAFYVETMAWEYRRMDLAGYPEVLERELEDEMVWEGEWAREMDGMMGELERLGL